MKFGPVAVDQAEGAVLAHGMREGTIRLGKGHVLRREDIDALIEAGIGEIVVARLEEGDIGEDDASARIAAALRGRGFSTRPPATGRANLHADVAGVVKVNAALIHRLNRIDPAITIATLADHAVVREGQMVATVKIIPFAVAEAAVAQAEAIAAEAVAFEVHAFRPQRVGLIQTELAGTKRSVLDKTARMTAERLDRSGSRIVAERRSGHDIASLTPNITELMGEVDMLIVFGASAISDPADIIPAAITRAGGEILRVGMPVDPGNLITIGTIDGKPVLGAPGCARSPKENGFDWVLDRLSAGLTVTASDIAELGVGGLLMEIASRPQPREAHPKAVHLVPVHGLLLAAGSSRRMGGSNKLLATFDGVPLVRRSAETLLAGGITALTVVTGHDSDRVRDALAGLDIRIVHNQDHDRGLSASLRRGLAELPADAAGALIGLGDMPKLGPAHIRTLVERFSEAQGGAIVRATDGERRGNPVILPRALVERAATIDGDRGARDLITGSGMPVITVDLGEAASFDVDTPERLAEAGGKPAQC